MRIALLAIPAPWSGAEVHTVGLAKTLRQRGHEPVIFELGSRAYSLDANRSRIPDGVEVVHIENPAAKDQPFEGWSTGSWSRVLARCRGDVAVLVKGHFGAASWRFDLAAKRVFGRYATIEHMFTPLPRPRTLLGMPRVGLWWYRESAKG